MSAKALAACSFEPVGEQRAATDLQVPEGLAAEIQFREDLWRGYRLEAITAGFSAAQATEYATELSSAMDLVAGVSEMSPVGRGWFYQTRPGVARRTITSGLIELTHWGKSKSTGRIKASGAPIFAFGFRPWNPGGRS